MVACNRDRRGCGGLLSGSSLWHGDFPLSVHAEVSPHHFRNSSPRAHCDAAPVGGLRLERTPAPRSPPGLRRAVGSLLFSFFLCVLLLCTGFLSREQMDDDGRTHQCIAWHRSTSVSI